jgi:hypothetical protein
MGPSNSRTVTTSYRYVVNVLTPVTSMQPQAAAHYMLLVIVSPLVHWYKHGDNRKLRGYIDGFNVGKNLCLSKNLFLNYYYYYFQKKILKQETESRCRLCKVYEETTDHLISECPTLAKNEYIIRHDKVCTRLHYSIYKKSRTATTENWYSHIPKSATKHEDTSVTKSMGTRSGKQA